MATLKTTIRTPSVVRTIVRGMGRPGESGAATPIPANTAPANFTGAEATPTPQTKSAWLEWLDVPSNFAFGTVAATVVDLAGDVAALETAVLTKVDNTDPRLLTDGDKGDIVVSGSGATWTIDWATIYARTTDPGVEGQPWNDNGLLRFSTGYSPGLDFSVAANSMYVSLLIEEF